VPFTSKLREYNKAKQAKEIAEDVNIIWHCIHYLQIVGFDLMKISAI
jgi:hypothetical protein